MTDTERDALIEEIAMMLEESGLGDFQGIFARTKRGREDADLRRRCREEQRGEMARVVRAFKTGGGRDNRQQLVWLAQRLDAGKPCFETLPNLWPMAWVRWIDVTMNVSLTGNTIPAETSITVTITEKGREVIAAMEAFEASKGTIQ